MVDPRAASGALNVRGVQAAHVDLIHGNRVLEGVFLGTGQDAVGFYLGLEFFGIVLAAAFGEVLLARWDLRGELFGLPVVPGAIREVALLVEGTPLVVRELVVVHNKIMK